ncbi:unnamed protein product [Ectocarpus sp. CCAP 1310/34]|nr:unnamed protein product [Ectocarpus sp. CCAP 1310/34]
MTTADSALKLDPSFTSMHIRISYARAGFREESQQFDGINCRA